MTPSETLLLLLCLHGLPHRLCLSLCFILFRVFAHARHDLFLCVLVSREVRVQRIRVGQIPVRLMKASRQALVLGPCQIILSEVFQASLRAPQSDRLLVLPTTIVLLHLIIEYFLELLYLSLVDVLVDLLV